MMRNELKAFLSSHDMIIEVTLTHLKGSSPREVGATLFVADEAICGTIGGGQLEYMAIDEARRMMRRREGERHLSVPLGPEIGQCCGGVVALQFTLMDHRARQAALRKVADEISQQPKIYIFGAGHVGRALAQAMHLLPVNLVVVDSREEELGLLALPIEKCCTPLPEAEIRTAPPGSTFVVLTHDHALDFILVREALMRDDAAYVGMIGSKSKRGSFSNWLRDEMPRDADYLLQDLICPIGAIGASDKRPAVVAAMVAAEIMIVLEAVYSSQTANN